MRDDGVAGARVDGGSGLLGLRDRAAAAGVKLHIADLPAGGTAITATLPVIRDPREAAGSGASE
ncbi:MAG: hypothetical protein LC808_34075 [Actinobacteria bacterium]|nr:hypothetical protein [Actinomycetota bacterium]